MDFGIPARKKRRETSARSSNLDPQFSFFTKFTWAINFSLVYQALGEIHPQCLPHNETQNLSADFPSPSSGPRPTEGVQMSISYWKYKIKQKKTANYTRMPFLIILHWLICEAWKHQNLPKPATSVFSPPLRWPRSSK